MGACPYCGYDELSSHYHCGRCQEVTSMMGHYVQLASGDEWAEQKAVELGVTLPWSGFTCDPRNERS